MRLRFLLFIFLLLPLVFFGQRRVLTFGGQFKPMIPSGFLNAQKVETEVSNVNYRTDQRFGYAAGFLIRRGFTDKLSLETGISFVQRNFSLNIDSLNNGYSTQIDYRIIGYEIPLVGLVYIQLSKEIFMNVSFGGTIDLYPSDVYGNDRANWSHETVRYNWAQVSMLANLGWEYRTAKDGTFYIGASFHRPFNPMYLSKIGHGPNPLYPDAKLDLNGNYLTLDFRYFFHEDPMKRKERKKKKKDKN